VSKFLGFLLGVVAALVGPAAFGVLAADGGIELNAKEMALAYGIGALIFWAVVSYFSGAAALGAALTFGAMIYAVHWIPNRTTNFLNDIPGVTTGMIDGIKQYTLNGVVPILAVISLVYAIQLITQSVQRRRRERAEAERQLREQEEAQAAEAAAVYPAAGGEYPVDAGGEYPTTAESRFSTFGNTSYDDLFEEEPEPIRPRLQSEEQTMQFAPAPVDAEQTAVVDAEGNDDGEDTQLMAPDRDETVAVATEEPAEEPAEQQEEEEEAPAAEAEQVEQEVEPEAIAPPREVPEDRVQPFQKEQVGQQYRERMDGPDPEDTGEFHIGAFENPNPIADDRPQAPRIVDLPGQFRPAGA
jgi:hypothetical protein